MSKKLTLEEAQERKQEIARQIAIGKAALVGEAITFDDLKFLAQNDVLTPIPIYQQRLRNIEAACNKGVYQFSEDARDFLASPEFRAFILRETVMNQDIFPYNPSVSQEQKDRAMKRLEELSAFKKFGRYPGINNMLFKIVKKAIQDGFISRAIFSELAQRELNITRFFDQIGAFFNQIPETERSPEVQEAMQALLRAREEMLRCQGEYFDGRRRKTGDFGAEITERFKIYEIIKVVGDLMRKGKPLAMDVFNNERCSKYTSRILQCDISVPTSLDAVSIIGINVEYIKMAWEEMLRAAKEMRDYGLLEGPQASVRPGAVAGVDEISLSIAKNKCLTTILEIMIGGRDRNSAAKSSALEDFERGVFNDVEAIRREERGRCAELAMIPDIAAEHFRMIGLENPEEAVASIRRVVQYQPKIAECGVVVAEALKCSDFQVINGELVLKFDKPYPEINPEDETLAQRLESYLQDNVNLIFARNNSETLAHQKREIKELLGDGVMASASVSASASPVVLKSSSGQEV